MMIGLDTDDVHRLLEHPTRLKLLGALRSTPMITTTNLAALTDISPSRLRSHLVVLRDAGLVDSEVHKGRQLHRIASPEIAAAIAPLTTLRTSIPTGLHDARFCYDHLAGRLGVAVTEALLERGHIRPDGPDFVLTGRGRLLFRSLGLDLENLQRQRRHFARQCIDGNERRPHLSGALGADLARHMTERGWIRREPDSRHVTVTETGRKALANLLGVRL
ncbi:MAG: transcriptional regulator [Rhodospirillaceae bacterium]|nr:transcriptional regulator [Rhodospirillaceae bacterium]|tara:strand:- start:481 stop:1137 length:657 start_codon:yes stop_codon:yes gene_type:complete